MKLNGKKENEEGRENGRVHGKNVKISNVLRVWLDAIQIILLVREKVRNIWCKKGQICYKNRCSEL